MEALCAHAGGAIVWRKDFGAEAAINTLRMDPTNARRMCVCGARGALHVLHFGVASSQLSPASADPSRAPQFQELRLADSQNYQVQDLGFSDCRQTSDPICVALPLTCALQMQTGSPSPSSQLSPNISRCDVYG